MKTNPPPETYGPRGGVMGITLREARAKRELLEAQRTIREIHHIASMRYHRRKGAALQAIRDITDT